MSMLTWEEITCYEAKLTIQTLSYLKLRIQTPKLLEVIDLFT